MNAKSWYKSLGIPYRRGYLFYGPPGCGKSSFIKVLGGYFGLGICLANLNSRDISDDSLNILLNEAPGKSIIVIEDIDAAMGTREDGEITNGKHNPGLTLSGLLNTLDGIASQEGRLIFMTTNKRQLLDPALLRPGRIDHKAYFGLASQAQVAEMYQLFFPQVDSKLSKEFASKIPPNKYSMAEVQKYLMFFRENLQGAIEHASKIGEISEDSDICSDRQLNLTDDVDWFSSNK